MREADSCSHDEPLEKLRNHLRNGRDVILVGGSRTKRNTLIRRYFDDEDVRRENFCLRADISQTRNLQEFSRVFLEAFRSLPNLNTGESLQDYLAVGTPWDDDPRFVLARLFSYADEMDRMVIIAVEEMEILTEYENGRSAEALLRTEVQHSRNTRMIYSGGDIRKLGAMFRSYDRPFYAEGVCLWLGPGR